MKWFVIAAILYMAVSAPSEPRKHGATPKQGSDARPQHPVALVDNSSRTAQADRPQEKTSKAETPIEWANWALVFIGLLTFYAVWKQAQESANATQAMRDSIPLQKNAADAALLNAQALINSDRPWVVIFTTNRSGRYSFRAGNLGRTPAQIISFSAEFRCVSNLKRTSH